MGSTKKFFSEKNLLSLGNLKPTKKFKGKIKTTDTLNPQSGGTKLLYGDAGFRALHACKFTGAQLDAVRRSLLPIRWKTLIWLKVKPSIPVTKKPVGSRMGKGKGKYKTVVGNIFRNQVILEFMTLDFARYGRFIRSALGKLPVRIALVFNRERSGQSNEDPPLDAVSKVVSKVDAVPKVDAAPSDGLKPKRKRKRKSLTLLDKSSLVVGGVSDSRIINPT